jgi:hypothetical protein
VVLVVLVVVVVVDVVGVVVVVEVVVVVRSRTVKYMCRYLEPYLLPMRHMY